MGNILNKITESIVKKDNLYTPSALNLHFDGDLKLKTLTGGILTILI